MIKYYKLNFYIQSKNYATQKLNNGFIFDHAPPPTPSDPPPQPPYLLLMLNFLI